MYTINVEDYGSQFQYSAERTSYNNGIYLYQTNEDHFDLIVAVKESNLMDGISEDMCYSMDMLNKRKSICENITNEVTFQTKKQKYWSEQHHLKKTAEPNFQTPVEFGEDVTKISDKNSAVKLECLDETGNVENPKNLCICIEIEDFSTAVEAEPFVSEILNVGSKTENTGSKSDEIKDMLTEDCIMTEPFDSEMNVMPVIESHSDNTGFKPNEIKPMLKADNNIRLKSDEIKDTFTEDCIMTEPFKSEMNVMLVIESEVKGSSNSDNTGFKPNEIKPMSKADCMKDPLEISIKDMSNSGNTGFETNEMKDMSKADCTKTDPLEISIKNTSNSECIRLELSDVRQVSTMDYIKTEPEDSEMKDMYTAYSSGSKPVPCNLYKNLVYKETEAKFPDQSREKLCQEMVIPIHFFPGVKICGKAPGYPWRLCVVCEEPGSGIYTLTKGRIRMYHVNFSLDTNDMAWLDQDSILGIFGNSDHLLVAGAIETFDMTKVQHCRIDEQNPMSENQSQSSVDTSDRSHTNECVELEGSHTEDKYQLVSCINKLLGDGNATGCRICREHFQSCLLLIQHIRSSHIHIISLNSHILLCFACNRFITEHKYMKAHQNTAHSGIPLIYAGLEIHPLSAKFTKICIFNGEKNTTTEELAQCELAYCNAMKQLEFHGFMSEKEKLKTEYLRMVHGNGTRGPFPHVEIGIMPDKGGNQVSHKGDNQVSKMGDYQLDTDNVTVKSNKTAESITQSKLSHVTSSSVDQKSQGKDKSEVCDRNRMDCFFDSLICNWCSEHFTGKEKEHNIHVHFYEHFHKLGMFQEGTKDDKILKSVDDWDLKKFLAKKIDRCDLCQKQFSTPFSVRFHLDRSHICMKCSICEKIILKMSTLDHIRVHKENEKVQCDICGRWYKNTKNMKQHKIRHCKDTKCEVCGLLMGRMAYRNHLRNHHKKPA